MATCDADIPGTGPAGAPDPTEPTGLAEATGPTEATDLTPEWLSDVLDCQVRSVHSIDRVGTGQMSRNFRLALDSDGPPTVIVKVPASQANVRELGANAYRREVYFYADVADRIDSGLATCLHHEITDDGTDFLLILQDMAPAVQGDQLTGCSVEQAEMALSNLAGIHAAAWNDTELLEGRALAVDNDRLIEQIYSLACDEFIERYSDRLTPGTGQLLVSFADHVGAWRQYRPKPHSIVHGDYRLDNLLFTNDAVVAVDWQTVGAGPPGRDVAYFLGNSLTVDDRRANEDLLLSRYLTALAGHGVELAEADLRETYAIGGWLGPLVTVVGAFVAARTDRGDSMFVAMANRAAAQLADHDSLALVAAL